MLKTANIRDLSSSSSVAERVWGGVGGGFSDISLRLVSLLELKVSGSC